MPRAKKWIGPPAGEPWVWHTLTLVHSMAWRGRSHISVWILEVVEIENMRQGGKTNGRLVVTYQDFVRFGLRHKSLAAGIRECEWRGLLRASRDGRDLKTGKKLPTMYRLTYLPALDDNGVMQPPTDEWKRFRPSEKQKPRGKNAPEPRGKNASWPE